MSSSSRLEYLADCVLSETNGNVRDVLQEAVSLAEEPFVAHPLGFLRCRLGASTRGPLLLHCWPGDDQALQSAQLTVHQHSVEVASLVLHGGLRDRRFVWQDDPRGSHVLFAQDLERPRAGLARTERIGDCHYVSESSMGLGDRYSVAQHDFHQTIVDWSSVVATLVVFVDGPRGTPHIVAQREAPAQLTYSPPIIDQEEIRETLAACLDRAES